MNKENECPDFKLDDWGVCTYKFNWDNEDCDNNCVKQMTNEEVEARIAKMKKQIK